MVRRSFIWSILILVGQVVPAQENESVRSAWQALVADYPAMIHDRSVPAEERRILQALTPEAAAVYLNGADPSTIRLPGGERLSELIEGIRLEQAGGLVFQSMEPCRVLDTREEGASWSRNEERKIRLEKGDCGLPGFVGESLKTHRARSVVLRVALEDVQGSGDLAIWPANDYPEPNVGLVRLLERHERTVVVPVCDEISAEPCPDGDVVVRFRGGDAHLVLDLLGYFVPAQPLWVEDQTGNVITEKTSTSPFWEQSLAESSNIHYSSGYVGIGTEAPTELLHVNGGNVVLEDRGGEVELQFLTGTGGGNTKIRKAGGANALFIERMNGSTLYTIGEWDFVAHKADLGLGVDAPGKRIDMVSKNGDDIQIRMSDDPERVGTATLGYSTEDKMFALRQWENGKNTALLIRRSTPSVGPAFQFDTDTKEGAAVITEDGKLGVGTSFPLEKLDVDGNIKLTGIDRKITSDNDLDIVSAGDICIGNC